MGSTLKGSFTVAAGKENREGTQVGRHSDVTADYTKHHVRSPVAIQHNLSLAPCQLSFPLSLPPLYRTHSVRMFQLLLFQ